MGKEKYLTNPRGVPAPPRPRLDRRDSGVTAAVWGKTKYLTSPRGVPIPPRPRLDRRDSGVTAAVGGKEKYLTNPRGDPIPPRPRLDRRDSGVTAAVWGKEKLLANPRGVPIPPRPRLDRRDSGVTAAVWGRELTLRPQSPTGRPCPPAAQAGPEGLGCNRCCVGVERLVCPQSYTGRPYPPSLHQAETARRPHVALAAAMGISRCRGWLGGVVLTPSYPLAAVSPYFNFIQHIPTGRPKWDSRHGGHGWASPYFIFLSKWTQPPCKPQSCFGCSTRHDVSSLWLGGATAPCFFIS